MAFGIRPADGEARLSYGSYLKVPELLELQQRLSEPEQHDELLFIIIHQVHELWFRQLLHELDAVIRCLDGDDVLGAHRLLRRCIEIQRVLVGQVSVLETMTPNDFLTFRDELMPASGFQSAQFRELEFLCGRKDERQLDHYGEGSRARARLVRRLGEPTLGDRFDALIDRRLPAGAAGVEDEDVGDVSLRVRTLIRLYQRPRSDYELYLLAEAMIEFDEMFYLWRLRHIAMVERMIGSKPGTGGSDGVAYLRTTLGHKFFPDLWEVRTGLGVRAGAEGV
jgi:tryptophan 2,3-dioxygenase